MENSFHFFPLWKRGMKGDLMAFQKAKLLHKIEHLGIAASLMLLAMTARNGFFRNLLVVFPLPGDVPNLPFLAVGGTLFGHIHSFRLTPILSRFSPRIRMAFL